MERNSLSRPLPRYERPPLSEVVCGVQFEPLEKLSVPQFGELWRKFKPTYSTCQETSPLPHTLERFEPSPTTEIQPPSIPFLPRIWFVHQDGSGIIQVQKDRFLHNWRGAGEDYPHYEQVMSLFRKHYRTFRRFLEEGDLGVTTINQYEMTYINHIPQRNGWEHLGDLGNVFPDFSWRKRNSWRPRDHRFLSRPDGCILHIVFDLPDRSGRLHVTIRDGINLKNQERLLSLDLTVRGVGADRSQSAMDVWYDTAHEWIVQGFADLCGQDIQQKIWARTR